MSHRRPLVLAILIYVTLDLSLAGMPGAFVFEPADSAEGTQVRARAAVETVALPAMARAPGPVLLQPPLLGDEWRVPVTSGERHARPGGSWRPRPQYDSASPSEDPH